MIAGLASPSLRPIPVEVLRHWYAERTTRSSIRQVADAAGVGRSTLHKFVTAGTHPHPRIRRLLALFYEYERDREPDGGPLPPEADALEMLLGGVERGSTRVRCTREMLDALDRAHEHEGRAPPGWSVRLREETNRLAAQLPQQP
jgi:AcrR family transcriptional regulator